jgi:AraC family transcriptional regulator, transcriptional activator of pobA
MQSQESEFQRPAKRVNQTAPTYGFAPQSDDGVMLELQRLNRDHVLTTMGLHGHTFFELIYFDQGGGTHVLGGIKSKAREGSLFVVCPGDLHDCTNIGDAEGWVLLFTRSALEQSPESLAFSQEWLPKHPLFDPFLSLAIRSRNPLRIAREDRTRWSQYLNSLDAELKNKPAHYRHAARALLHLILVELARLLEPAERRVDDDPVLQDVFSFIDAQFRKPISLADVARSLGRTPAHLTTIVRRKTGLTVGGWIAERRMAHARTLLQTGPRQKTDDLSLACGYDDPSHFLRSFKRMHGASPAQWRANFYADFAQR